MPLASHLFLLILLTTSSSGWRKGSFPFYLSSVIFDDVQKAETRVGAQGKSIRLVETVHCCSKSGPGADTLFSHFLWVSPGAAKWVSKMKWWMDRYHQLWWLGGNCWSVLLSKWTHELMFLSWWYCLLGDAAETLGSDSLPEEVGH